MKQTAKYVCECKCVTKHEIVRAIRKLKASTLNDIQVITKAATGCGRCKPIVHEILLLELNRRKSAGLQFKLNFDET